MPVYTKYMDCEKTRAEAEAEGFAGFNAGTHVCLDLPDENTTISVRTPDGSLVTFAFNKRYNAVGHQCVDVVHHGEARNADGNPLQTASFLGQGPTVAVTKPTDDVPTTIVVLQLPKVETAPSVDELVKQVESGDYS